MLQCAIDDALREEWEQYLAKTRNHVDVLSELCDAFGIDIANDTVGRKAQDSRDTAIDAEARLRADGR